VKAAGRPRKATPQEERPVDLKNRVEQVLAEEVAAALAMDGTVLEVVEVRDGVARVRLRGGCGCGPSSIMAILLGIEAELRRRVPEVDYLELVP
jgi:Fe-S cluster biogenesis protein NfuA